MINDLNMINEIRYLFINETEIEKQIKKVIFISISLVLPFLEIIILILQTKNIIDSFENSNDKYFEGTVSGFFGLCSLFCTWALISNCFKEIVTILILLSLKIIFINIILFIIRDISNFSYHLTFNIILFGTFSTLIFTYKSFRKPII